MYVYAHVEWVFVDMECIACMQIGIEYIAYFFFIVSLYYRRLIACFMLDNIAIVCNENNKAYVCVRKLKYLFNEYHIQSIS